DRESRHWKKHVCLNSLVGKRNMLHHPHTFAAYAIHGRHWHRNDCQTCLLHPGDDIGSNPPVCSLLRTGSSPMLRCGAYPLCPSPLYIPSTSILNSPQKLHSGEGLPKIPKSPSYQTTDETAHGQLCNPNHCQSPPFHP